MATQRSTSPLTPTMVEAIKNTEPGDLMKAGGTRAALMRRGLVHDRESGGTFGTLTDSGLQARAKMIPAAQAEAEARRADSAAYHASLAAKVDATPVQEDPSKVQINEWLDRHNVRLEDTTDEGIRKCAEAYHAAIAADWDEALEGIATPVARQNGKTAAMEAALDPQRGDTAEDWAGPYAASVRTRYHGKTLGQRRSARKAQRAARRRNRR